MNNIKEFVDHIPELPIYEEVSCPSGKKLHVRPLTGEEEQILATPKYHRDYHGMPLAYDMLLRRCIREADNKKCVEWFTEEDRKFLIIWLMGVSYSPIKEMEIQCPEGHKFITEIDLGGLYVSDGKVDTKINMICPIDCGEFEFDVWDCIHLWPWRRQPKHESIWDD